MEHNCNEFCSGRVTNKTLESLGYTLEKVEKIVGADVVTVPGMKRDDAKYAAWKAGKLRLCSK